MQRKRRLVILLAALVSTVLVAACSSGPSASNGGGGGGGNTLRLSTVATDRNGIEAVLKEFKQANSGADITVNYSDTDQYQGTLRTQLASGTAPDVFFAWPGNGNPGAIEVLAPTGFLADLSGRPWVSKIPPNIKPVTQVDGKTYIVPETFVGIGAIYDKKGLAALGLQPPKTWTELLAFCDAAKAKGKVAFALGNQTNWVTQLVDYALVATTVYATNPDFDQKQQAGQATFVGSGWETAMDKYLEMNQRGCFSKDPLGTSVENSIAQVGSGKAIAVIQVTSVLPQIKSQAPKGAELGMFPVPATDNVSETKMPGAAGGAYAINAKAKNMDLATKLIDFMATPQGMNAYAKATANLPAIPNDQFKLDPTLQTLVEFQKDNKTVPFMDQLWPNPKVQNVHFTVVQDMFSGKLKPPEALAQMDQAYKQGS